MIEDGLDVVLYWKDLKNFIVVVLFFILLLCLSSIDAKKGRQRGRVVRAPDIQPRGRGLKARSDRLAELILGRP